MDARRRLAIAMVATVVVALVVGGALALVRAFREPPAPKDLTIVPAERTEEPTRSDTPTYTVPATGTVDVETPLDAGASGRAPLVAYRREGRLCVAAEDGTGERVVAETAHGPFALSPDGSALAVVDLQEGRLSIVAVDNGIIHDVGPALAETPAWSADSAWLAYAAPGPVVRRVRSDASANEWLFQGRLPAVGPDGTVVGAATAEERPGVRVWHDGSAVTIETRSAVTGLACGDGVAYCGLAAGDGINPTLASVPLAGGAAETIVATPAAARPVVFVDLALSPSGSHLAYGEHGDDGYSRVFVLPLGGGPPAGLALRRDTYVMGWASVGDTLLVLEGNAVQGEAATLVSVATDGAPRRYLAEGVSRW